MKWASLVVLVAVGLFGAYIWLSMRYGSELSHKTGWSVLQAFELDERGKPFVSPELRRTKDGEFTAIAILGVGQPEGGPTYPPSVTPEKAWVLLDEHAADRMVLILPQFSSYRVSCATVGKLPNAVPDVDGYVLKRLSEICS